MLTQRAHPALYAQSDVQRVMPAMAWPAQMRDARPISLRFSARALPRATPGTKLETELLSCTGHPFDIALIYQAWVCLTHGA